MRSLNLFLMTILMTASFPAVGNDFSNSGTRGGGSVVDANGRPRLRDLVEQTECEWITAADFIRDEVGQLDALLARIEQIDWYVADKLRTEGLSLNICKSDRRLRTVPVEETDGLTIYQPLRNLRQVAIRVNRDVYIDMATFRRLPDSEKASLYLHETLHSFIQTDVPNRNSLLMNAVRYLSQVSPSTSPENFALNIQKNKVNICTGCSSQLAPFKEAFLNMLNPTLPAEQRQAAAIALIPASPLLPREEYLTAALLILDYEIAQGHTEANPLHFSFFFEQLHHTRNTRDTREHFRTWMAYRFNVPLTARFLSNILLAPPRDPREARDEFLPATIGAVLYGSDEDASRFLSSPTLLTPFFFRGLSDRYLSSLPFMTIRSEWLEGVGYESSIYNFVKIVRPALLPVLCARPDAAFPNSPCNRR